MLKLPALSQHEIQHALAMTSKPPPSFLAHHLQGLARSSERISVVERFTCCLGLGDVIRARYIAGNWRLIVAIVMSEQVDLACISAMANESIRRQRLQQDLHKRVRARPADRVGDHVFALALT